MEGIEMSKSKQGILGIASVAMVGAMLTACHMNVPGTMGPTSQSDGTVASDLPYERVRYKYMTVVGFDDGHVVLEDTNGQIYWIDASLVAKLHEGDGFHNGDLVLMSFDPDTTIDDGGHTIVSPTHIEKTDNHYVADE